MTIQQEIEAVNEQISNIQSLIGFIGTTLRLTMENDPFANDMRQATMAQQRQMITDTRLKPYEA